MCLNCVSVIVMFLKLYHELCVFVIVMCVIANYVWRISAADFVIAFECLLKHY